ncbi:SCY1-like protein 2 [Sesamum angolense]|uniref:SCY1-like protein 2 n=1 Tax=Sesamum angolense TaxID=2727404 RepID=A0AAE1WDP5_9LAMI|nr:SCY1-like protein 2 [Sesamum angolense]
MSLNMKTLTQALAKASAKASAVIEKTVQTTVQEVTGLPRAMQDYELIDQIASAGPGLAWKLYSARSRDTHVPAVYPIVCVWMLDKKALSEARQRAGLSKAAEDAFLDVIRADAARLVRLRHPGVVHVVQALDESKNAMAMVTEPLFASVANALGNVENIPKVPKELKGMVWASNLNFSKSSAVHDFHQKVSTIDYFLLQDMGLLEVKHGLLQIAETLDFLHNNARLIHRAIAPELVKQIVLPRVHGLALKTTVAAVRVNALLCFSEMVHILDKSAVLDILQTIQRCTAVDHSAPTLMCTLGVANSILKQFGIEFVVEHVLPLLLPLLITQQLNVQQFAKYMLFIKDVLRKNRRKRGVTLTESGIPEVKLSQATDGYTLGQTNKAASTAPSITKRSSSWDEDWIPARPASTVPPSLAAISAAQPAVPSQPARGISTYSTSSTASVASTEQLPSSCPAVDVEWPPQSSSGVATQFGDFKNLNGNKGTSDSSLDDIDPFANWPPRPSGAPSVSTSLNNGTTASSAKKNGISNMGTPPNGLSFQSESWAFGMQATGESMSQNQGISSLPNVGSSSGGPSSQNSLGYLKQNLGTSALGFSTEKAADLESIFAPNKNEHAALRLAPPPTNAVGRVRTRGRGSQGQTGSSSPSGRMKSQTQQTPLLDLL